ETDESILRKFYVSVPLRLASPSTWELAVPPAVLERERIRDRQRRGRRDTYPVFAGITLDQELVARLDTGEIVDIAVKPSDVEGSRFVADVVDLETGEVLFEANQPVPGNLAERLEGKSHTDIELF